MLNMYHVDKESTVYVMKNTNVETSSMQQRGQDDVLLVHGGEESEYSLSDESYHSSYSTDVEIDGEEHGGDEHYKKDSRTIKVNSTFENVIEFRRALVHYAITNEFAYFTEKSEPTRVTARCVDLGCKWRIHASIQQDGITFEVKTLVEPHSCTESKKGANKVASQGWIASVLKDKLKSDGDVSPIVLQKWIMKNYNVDVPYMRVFRGKEQAYNDMYGKWEDSFLQMNEFKEELLRRNPGSVVERAAGTYSITEHEKVLNDIDEACQDVRTYLDENHKSIWSRCKFGIMATYDYMTNNVLEAFNSWIGDARYKPVIDLLDCIREKIMIRLDKKRRLLKTWKGTLVPRTKRYLNKISKNLGIYEVCRSGENRAEVKYMDRRWDVSLDDKTCTCGVWQVRGVPCIHATAFITFTMDENWDNFVDSYFTIEKFKLAYALEVSPMPARDQWVHMDIGEKIYPPAIKRPPGRLRKNRIKPNDEPKKRQKCGRCGEYGHRQKTCKNAASQDEESTSKRRRENN
ncbi:hypothetical protein SSX86_002361 [Deinandra increscens subsp. villosa]|uniref:SWIM-type domain-containing protein n=1 Tax=Deinandra increscens subsp. villosa TaxID=3103831 RepID=A0AAP0DNX0_9ASTR